MKERHFVVFLLTHVVTVLVIAASAKAETTTFFIVRHAEKESGSDDVSLSETGKKRAKTLAQILAPFKVTQVYVTDTKRAKQTAEPAAASLPSDQTKTYDYTAAVISGLPQQHSGKSVLIVGHSNTVHLIVNTLAGSSETEIGDTFDNLFVVTVDGTKKSVVRLRYATTP